MGSARRPLAHRARVGWRGRGRRLRAAIVLRDLVGEWLVEV
jgi:hypothetical protein